MHLKDFYGFTLAEVLITLGIVGIVAAMTLPTLKNTYDKQVRSAQFFKLYSEITNAFQLTLAKDEVSEVSQTSAWAERRKFTYGYCNNYLGTKEKIKTDPCIKFFTTILPGATGHTEAELNYNKKYSSWGIIRLKNGAYIYDYYLNPISKDPKVNYNVPAQNDVDKIRELGGRMVSEIGKFRLDINGEKKPNVLGKDIFIFHISEDGKIYPEGGRDYAIYFKKADWNSFYWNGSPTYGARCSKYAWEGCGGRNIEEHKMYR